MEIALKTPLEVQVSDPSLYGLLRAHSRVVWDMAKCTIVLSTEEPRASATGVVRGRKLVIPLEGVVDLSAEVARNAVDLYCFTRTLREALDNEGRHQTVRMMWEIVYADGKPNEFEANIIWRAADLLGVSSRQRVALRQLVLADNASLGAGVGGFRRDPTCNFEPIESKTHDDLRLH